MSKHKGMASAVVLVPELLARDGKLVPLGVVAVKDRYLVSIKAMGPVDTHEKYWQEYGKPTFPPQPGPYDFSDLRM